MTPILKPSSAFFREICAIKADDAVVFDIEGLAVDRVRDEMEYGGLRIMTNATVDGARVRVLVDIGFGDAVEAGLTEIELSVLLDQPAPRLRAYPYETVIADKFQAMVMLGRVNSRMKDFYDIWILARSHEFEGDRLARAIAATFARRKTEIPSERPDALTPAFADDATKQQQWKAFLEDIAVNPRVPKRALDLQPLLGQGFAPSFTNKKRDIGTTLKQATAEIAANCLGTEHQVLRLFTMGPHLQGPIAA